MRSARAAAWSSARRSIQIMAGRRGRPFASQITMPSSWLPNEMPAIDRGLSTSVTRPATAAATAFGHRAGSCSAHPGRGKERSWSSYLEATSVPSSR